MVSWSAIGPRVTENRHVGGGGDDDGAGQVVVLASEFPCNDDFSPLRVTAVIVVVAVKTVAIGVF